MLGVTEDSCGNGVGIGNADYTTRKVANGLDLTADLHELDHRGRHRGRPHPGGAAGRSDRAARHGRDLLALRSRERRLCQIRSTLYLNEILISPSLFEEVEGRSDVERLSDPQPLEFSADGDLLTRV